MDTTKSVTGVVGEWLKTLGVDVPSGLQAAPHLPEQEGRLFYAVEDWTVHVIVPYCIRIQAWHGLEDDAKILERLPPITCLADHDSHYDRLDRLSNRLSAITSAYLATEKDEKVQQSETALKAAKWSRLWSAYAFLFIIRPLNMISRVRDPQMGDPYAKLQDLLDLVRDGFAFCGPEETEWLRGAVTTLTDRLTATQHPAGVVG